MRHLPFRTFSIVITLLMVNTTLGTSGDQFGDGPCSDARRAGAIKLQGLYQSGQINAVGFNLDKLIEEQKALVACDSTNPLGHSSVMGLLMKAGRYEEALEYHDVYAKYFEDPRFYLLLRIAIIEELGDSATAKKMICEEYERCHEEFNTGKLKPSLLKKKHYSVTAFKAEERYDCNGVAYDLRDQYINSELEANYRIGDIYLSKIDAPTRAKILRDAAMHRERDSVRYERTTLKEIDAMFLAKSVLR